MIKGTIKITNTSKIKLFPFTIFLKYFCLFQLKNKFF